MIAKSGTKLQEFVIKKKKNHAFLVAKTVLDFNIGLGTGIAIFTLIEEERHCTKLHVSSASKLLSIYCVEL